MYRVSYFLRRTNDYCTGLLVERSKTFVNFQDAVDFIRSLRQAPDVIGAPLVSLKE